MLDVVILGGFLIAIVGLAAGALFVKDRLGKPLKIITKAIMRFVTPALGVTLAIVLVAALVSGVSENWGSVVCWRNDQTGSLSRTCAAHKIIELGSYNGAEIVDVTGIADISENVKKVEYKWRMKPSKENQNPQSVDAAVSFRKYDDGWRVAQ
jgi:hypothetical protein